MGGRTEEAGTVGSGPRRAGGGWGDLPWKKLQVMRSDTGYSSTAICEEARGRDEAVRCHPSEPMHPAQTIGGASRQTRMRMHVHPILPAPAGYCLRSSKPNKVQSEEEVVVMVVQVR
jgi:hypothetical protein